MKEMPEGSFCPSGLSKKVDKITPLGLQFLVTKMTKTEQKGNRLKGYVRSG